MLARTYTAALSGLAVTPIEVEIHGKQGIPQLIFIGLTSRAVEEAKERITSALQNCGVRIRGQRTIVNLAPASQPKSGTAFDLAIAVGLLKLYGEIRLDATNLIFFGELGLDGQVKPVAGILPLVIGALKNQSAHVIVPAQQCDQLHALDTERIIPIAHLSDILTKKIDDTLSLPSMKNVEMIDKVPPIASPNTEQERFFSLITGQASAKRALMLSAAGGLNTLLIGPPGTGKTKLVMLSQHLLPPLTTKEQIDVTAIHSLAGMQPHTGLIVCRPFRAPHHSISRTALIGGGQPIRPGELSLAHRGILFLDELLEFSGPLLDMLRQPIEDGYISLAFSTTKTTFPSQVTLIAATNPCPCGYFGALQKNCVCSPGSIDRYQQKLSGPLLDRFDIIVHMEIERSLFTNTTHSDEMTGGEMRAVVAGAHQELANMSTFTTERFESSARQLFYRTGVQQALSGRKYHSLLRLCHTIALFDRSREKNEELTITMEHVQEALSFQQPLRRASKPM